MKMVRPPYRSYAAIMATFAGGLAPAGVSAARSARPQCHSALDFSVLSSASLKPPEPYPANR